MPVKKKRPSSTRPRAVLREKCEAVGMPNLANLEILVKQLLENLGENPSTAWSTGYTQESGQIPGLSHERLSAGYR
jgi:hypothetical protein